MILGKVHMYLTHHTESTAPHRAFASARCVLRGSSSGRLCVCVHCVCLGHGSGADGLQSNARSLQHLGRHACLGEKEWSRSRHCWCWTHHHRVPIPPNPLLHDVAYLRCVSTSRSPIWHPVLLTDKV